MSSWSPLSSDFFAQSPLQCARELIGCRLVWRDRVGRIVETEAYDAEDDEACHTFFRPSARRFVAEKAPGTAYVYLNYGMHWLFNLLVKGERQGFVLIRALEPVEGLAAMRRRRNKREAIDLCSGPGKLTKALGLDRRHHGLSWCDPGEGRCVLKNPGLHVPIMVDGRIGISKAKHLPWRFLEIDNAHVSVKPKCQAG